MLFFAAEASAQRQASRPRRKRKPSWRPHVAEHGPAFPVPPLDLPHYHGIGVDPAAVSTAVSSPDSSAAAAEADAAKEVTGA